MIGYVYKSDNVDMTSFSNRFQHNAVINSVIITENTTFVLKLAKSASNFLKFHMSFNLRSQFCYYRRLESFKKNPRISKDFGSRSGETKVLTMFNVQNANFQLYQKIQQMCISISHHSSRLISIFQMQLSQNSFYERISKQNV